MFTLLSMMVADIIINLLNLSRLSGVQVARVDACGAASAQLVDLRLFYIYDHQSLLLDHVLSHDYDTRNRNRPIPPRERLRSAEQSVIYNGIRIWNEIPDDIKANLTKQSFKYHYKNYLLSRYIP